MLWNREGNEKTEDKAIKEAFEKVKNDISSLNNEIYQLKNAIFELKEALNNLEFYPTHTPTQDLKTPTHSNIPTHTPTVPSEIGGLKYPNLDTSIGNRGVPTDRQTNQQTDIPTHNSLFFNEKNANNVQNTTYLTLKEHIIDATEILNSLDSLKKEIRLKFKTMTNQEISVFSTIYQLEEQFPEGVEYRHIALKLGLTESSIRDYVHKLILKGIPINKIKLNNKKIYLTISKELKKVASLETILKLRDL